MNTLARVTIEVRASITDPFMQTQITHKTVVSKTNCYCQYLLDLWSVAGALDWRHRSEDDFNDHHHDNEIDLYIDRIQFLPLECNVTERRETDNSS